MAAHSSHVTTSANWSEIVSTLYPDILTSTHCVPPMYFNRVAYRREIVPGTSQPALVVQPPWVAGDAPVSHDLTPDSMQPMPSPPRNLWSLEPLQNRPRGPARVMQTDVNDDTAQAQVLRNLQVLGETRKEAMFIISQLNFSEYLHDPAYAAAVAQLPQIPVNIKTGKKLKGDFDILVIHRQHGILIGELKTVGKDPQSKTDAVINNTIEKAVRQLEKSKDVMSHLVSDVSPGVTVRTTLFLPFVSRDQLRRVFSNNPGLLKDACSVLNAADAKEAVQLCCCAEQLSDPDKWWEITPAAAAQLEAWWKARMPSGDAALPDDTYKDVVARFVGPATSVTVHCSTGPRVQVKTEGQAVSELGRRLTTLVLTPKQVGIMQRSSSLPLVYLSGPPGTGKTVLLTLVGLPRLRRGHDVHIVSVQDGSMAASRLIKTQVETTLAADSATPPGCGSVFIHHYDLNEETEKDKAVRELAACGPDLFLICDELIGLGPGLGLDVPRYFPAMLDELRAQVPQLSMWAAGVRHSVAPSELHEISLTTPLRSSPAVLREVGKQINVEWSGAVLKYSNSGIPSAGDGLQVEELVHETGNHNGHTGDEPYDCLLCGERVAAVLRRLGVGVPGSELTERDVFVLVDHMSYLTNDVINDDNTRTSRDCNFIQGLRGAGLALRVMANRGVDRSAWKREVGEVAEAAWNEIVVTDFDSVHGMERKVVVDVMPDLTEFRLYSTSRATSHLVVVNTERISF